MMTNNSDFTSALSENEGIEHPQITGKEAIERIKKLRRQSLDEQKLIEGILQHDKVALSRAITLIESSNPDHQEKANAIINACLPYANQSVRIGITGVPGVGKSTFIEAFGLFLLKQDKKIAVLAIDPSSTISKGSILGDKTRMEDLVKEENVFIRPSAAGESLGGVAKKTREAIILCEACGFNTILVETVGVGQSETAVHSMTDFFLLLNLAGAGDELQGIKRGIMEMADAVIINKADGDNKNRAQHAKLDINRALQLFPAKPSGWKPVVKMASALHHEGIDTIWDLISAYIELTRSNHFFEENRQNQNQYWMQETINTWLLQDFYQNEEIIGLIAEMKKAVAENEYSPFSAAARLIQLYKNQK